MNNWREEGGDLSFRDYQAAAKATDQAPVTDDPDRRGLMIPLLGLAGEAGSLLTEFKKWLRDGERYRPFADQASEEIGDILWYLSNIATKLNLDLEEVARENLGKIRDRWGSVRPGQKTLPSMGLRRYDDGYPPAEQLPGQITAEFRMVPEGVREKLEVMVDGEPCGDRLTDNAHVNDGYRFHDVFHLTCAVLLGWSPVLRKLKACKRKSELMVDEVEDGARARITEEAISAVVYGFAKDYQLFEGVDSVEYALLRTIQMMARPFEVHDRTPHEWQTVILTAFRVWRDMIRHNGGVFVGDANTGVVDYRPLD